MINIAYISVGSNMGNKISNCRRGIHGIGESGKSLIERCSDFYLTSPTDYENQDWFINVVVKVKTFLGPYDLFKELMGVQCRFGRKDNIFRFGPRKLDLDIIFYGNQIVHSSILEIPHPRMHERLFVLKPICDIDSAFIHPVFKISVGAIIAELGSNSSQKIISLGSQEY